MNLKRFFLALVWVLSLSICSLNAQPSTPQNGMRNEDGGIMSNLNLQMAESSFLVKVNTMSSETKEKLNHVASNYRSRNRSVWTDMGKSMLAGSVASVMNVIGTEIINLIELRSKQHKAWLEMRQKECLFIDSLQSVKGQSDFYEKPSNYGPLDPTNMNFDGITLQTSRNGKDVLRMVCHIDTTRFDHLFLHSKFYLVVDSIVYHPYESFLPNLKANRISKPKKDASQDEKDYWNTISRFSFDEQGCPTLNIRIDVTSSWINELVQVYQDVKLGSFSVNIPIREEDLQDSVYVYSREEALRLHRPTIDIVGDCFVVPRSYMPVSATSPSWGTGEYKMKVVLAERGRYNPDGKRTKHWHRDYKQLVRMQKNGKVRNEYLSNIFTTFRDNKNTIIKATYTPALNQVSSMMGLSTSVGAPQGMGSMKPSGSGSPVGASPAGGAPQKP